MTKQAQVGLFTLLGIIGLIVVFYVINDIGTRSSGYKIAVHFGSAAGLRPAALVYLSGVSIGAVDRIDLRPDFTTDVYIAVRKNVDIPVGSRFIINAPLTGEPNLQILPPKRKKGETGPLPVLPRDLAQEMEQMPVGTNPATITDLLEEGQGEMRRVSDMLKDLQRVEPQLLAEFRDTMRNADQLSRTANESLTRLSAQASLITDTLQRSLTLASTNVVDLTTTLNDEAKASSGKVDTLLVSLNTAAASLSASVDSLKALAQDKRIKDNLIDTTRSIALTTKTLADLTNDLRQVTGNPQTQGQLRDTVANIDAAAQKANSLLLSLGGRSSVYGVDAGATPYPGGSPGPGGAQRPGRAPEATSGGMPGNFKEKLAQFTKGVASVQIRMTQLAPQRPGSVGYGSPLLTSDRGPQTDVNLILFPTGKTALFAGVNDLGAMPTWNFAAMERLGDGRIGAGILYSRLGVLAGLRGRHAGVEARFYDPRHPTLDAYGQLILSPRLQLFGGERDVLQRDRRSVFGFQTQF
jgi:ABC-type transporter Mla subunit MlaD